MDLEREKGITIKARAVRLEYTAARRPGLRPEPDRHARPRRLHATRSAAALQACEGAILVVDAAQGIEAQTLANVHLALRQNLMIIPVINKIDLPSAQPDVVIEELENVLAIPREEVHPGLGQGGHRRRRDPRGDRGARSRRPRATRPAPLQGLVFDSHYDAYKGVVAYVRLAEGTLHEHDTDPADGLGGRIRDPGAGRLPAPARAGEAADGGRGGLRRDRASRASATPRSATRSRTPARPGRRAAARLPGGQEPGLRRHLPDHAARTTRSSGTPWRSSTSTTRASPTSPRARSPSASASAAASWACSTWRSSRSAWSASSTWT